jgi:hypothetical protein
MSAADAVTAALGAAVAEVPGVEPVLFAAVLLPAQPVRRSKAAKATTVNRRTVVPLVIGLINGVDLRAERRRVIRPRTLDDAAVSGLRAPLDGADLAAWPDHREIFTCSNDVC